MLLAALRDTFGLLRARPCRRLALLSAALSLALLVAALAVMLLIYGHILAGEGAEKGRDQGLADLFGINGIAFLLVASIGLMTPVAAVFGALSAGPVSGMIEHLRWSMVAENQSRPPARDWVNFTGLLVAANALTIMLIVFLTDLLGSAALLLWPMVNGALLGREYFTLVARRHLDPGALAKLRAAHRGRIWVAGIVTALFLSLPLLNLAAPFLGLAWFAHIFHRLRAG